MQTFAGGHGSSQHDIVSWRSSKFIRNCLQENSLNILDWRGNFLDLNLEFNNCLILTVQ